MKGYIFFFFLKTLIVFSCSDNYIPKNTKVLFLSNRDSPKGEFDIFITDINTSEKINLTKNIKFISYKNYESENLKSLIIFTKDFLYVNKKSCFLSNKYYFIFLDFLKKEFLSKIYQFLYSISKKLNFRSKFILL